MILGIDVYELDGEKYISDFNLAKIFGKATRQINSLRRYNSKNFDGCWLELDWEKSRKITSNYSVGYKVKIFNLKGCLKMAELCCKIKKINFKEKAFEEEIVKQLKIEGFRVRKKIRLKKQIPDLILTKNDEHYICEIQVGALDRDHLYRSLEYRDLYFDLTKIKPKVILYCESCPRKYEIISQIHNVEVRTQSFKGDYEIRAMKSLNMWEIMNTFEKVLSK